MASIVTVVALAFVAESLVEYFAAEWVGRWAKYVAAGVGVLMALNFGLDIFGEFLGLESRVPYAGMVLSGLLLGRGANFVNDFADRFLRKESARRESVRRRYGALPEVRPVAALRSVARQ